MTRAKPSGRSASTTGTSSSFFEPRKDGAIEDPGLEAQMGFLNIRSADWLLPFWEDYDPLGSDADDGESA